jgi:hypothetical protein
LPPKKPPKAPSRVPILAQHVAAEAVAAEGQRLRLRRLLGLEQLGALVPFLVARRQRVDVREIDVGPLGRLDRAGALRRCGAQQRRRRIRHADLGLPFARHQPQRGQHDERDEGRDDDQRDQPHAIGAETPPGGMPDAFALLLRVFGGAVGALQDDGGGHLRTTRGSATL